MTGTESLPDQVASIDIRASIEDVWAELTRRDDIQKAMFNSMLESEMEPGAKMHYYSPDRKFIFVAGELVEIDPPHRLVHTYRFTDLPEDETLVTWELETAGDGTRVTVTHSRFTDQAKTHKRVGGGWQTVLKLMKDILETGDISTGAKFQWWLMGAMSFMMPRSSRAEEVLRSEN